MATNRPPLRAQKPPAKKSPAKKRPTLNLAAKKRLPSPRKTAIHEIDVPPHDQIALVLQGGGALGAFQAGVYEELLSTPHRPNWIAGVSIGAINAALIAGNVPDKRL